MSTFPSPNLSKFSLKQTGNWSQFYYYHCYMQGCHYEPVLISCWSLPACQDLSFLTNNWAEKNVNQSAFVYWPEKSMLFCSLQFVSYFQFPSPFAKGKTKLPTFPCFSGFTRFKLPLHQTSQLDLLLHSAFFLKWYLLIKFRHHSSHHLSDSLCK